MKNLKKALLSLVVLLAVCLFSQVAFAAKNPYKDVTRRKVDSASYDAIVYVKQHLGWKDIAKKGRICPNRPITRREFMVVLFNFYGDRVPASIYDVKSANTKVSSAFCCAKMVELSKALGYPITWNGNSTMMRRKDVARYVKIFATYNPKFAPRR